MVRREEIIRELESRLWEITESNGFAYTVASVARNPIDVSTEFPCCNIYEMDDRVLSDDGKKTVFPVYKRELEIILELIIEPAMEASASVELMNFYENVRKAIFKDGDASLNGKCRFYEKAVSRPIAIPSNKTFALWVLYGAEYVDKIA